jgi:hypothetical protein
MWMNPFMAERLTKERLQATIRAGEEARLAAECKKTEQGLKRFNGQRRVAWLSAILLSSLVRKLLMKTTTV